MGGDEDGAALGPTMIDNSISVRRDLLQGAWLGHAVHPLLVEVPIGTWMSAAVLDLAGGERARDGAQLLTGVGLLAVVPTALTGWAEYPQGGRRSRRVAVVHAGANGLGAGLQLASWGARRSGHHRLGAALGLASLSLVGAAGYLGGHLAAARKVGSHDPSFGPDPADAPGTDAPGTAAFHVAADGSFSGLRDTGRSPAREVVEVQVVTLDGLASLRERQVDLLKIDVEGFEGAVLAGARERIRRAFDVHVAEVQCLLQVVARITQRIRLVERQLAVERHVCAELGDAFLVSAGV